MFLCSIYLFDMTASTPELIPLIYRHLKEHGFHTAAEELQKHSLQSETSTTTTLLDIYSSWIKSSKRKTKSVTSKRSTPDKKQTTLKKATPQKKKTDKTTKQPGSPNKKRKNGDGKAAEKKVKSSTSKSQKKKDDGGEDSDSDSSLDVEKWKRLVEQMTEADLAKVEALDALVAPEPKKPRVRKPRAKPKPKTETPTGKQEQMSKTSDKSTEDTLAKSTPPKKSHSKKVDPVATLNTTTQEPNITTPVANVISTPKQSPKKVKRKATIDQATIEPKQKKKKAATSNNSIVNATDGIVDKDLDHKKDTNPTEIKLTKGSQQNTTIDQTGSKKKKKDTTQNKVTANATDGAINKNVDDNKDVNTNNQTTIKLIEGSQEKTSNLQTEQKKKKKKDATPSKVIAKASDDADKNPTIEQTEASLEKTSNIQPKKKKIAGEGKVTADVLVDQHVEINTVEDINGDLLTKDLISSLNTTNAESIEKAKKKKKKKDKTKEDGEDGEQAVTEAKPNAVTNEGTCEKTAVESNQDTVERAPKKKKKKKEKDKEESETLQQENVIAEIVGVEEITQQIILKKKSKKKKKEREEHLETEGERVKTPVTQDSDEKLPEETPDALSTPQTPGSKKKKHKMKTEGLPKADAVLQMEESETPKKKKKTKSKETES